MHLSLLKEYVLVNNELETLQFVIAPGEKAHAYWVKSVSSSRSYQRRTQEGTKQNRGRICMYVLDNKKLVSVNEEWLKRQII